MSERKTRPFVQTSQYVKRDGTIATYTYPRQRVVSSQKRGRKGSKKNELIKLLMTYDDDEFFQSIWNFLDEHYVIEVPPCAKSDSASESDE